MFQTRSLTTGFLVASLGIASGLALFTAPEVSAADKCSADAGKNVSGLKAACDKGGIAEAKKLMNEQMKKAIAAGEKGLKCDSCHTDTKTYGAKPDAVEQYKAKIAPHLK